ncbi:PhpK family radical SAM P-methyltransferase [Actinokineospora iranica]|uniref:p-methyltransferase n=1 Tax=Actinokineospora iranica TaxID=1271860 RepID=A0A1G6QYF3_9PSEU|nr:PhpK family radical SAM P-methyltransferase [Actinokineospora iranica]SDC97004.1 p-methyltransferase [Actinokineospora iranica]
MTNLDCVLIGFNEIDFADFATAQEVFQESSGAYRELVTNSVLVGDRRLTYMDLLNKAMERTTGRPSALTAFEMPSLGVAYLASFLMRRGFGVGVVNFFNTGRDELAAMLAESPRAVAITTTYYVDDEPIRQIIRFIREHNPAVPIVVGGPRVHNLCSGQPPAVQDILLDSIGADVYIDESQGEATLAGVLTALREGGDLSKVPNLIYRGAPGQRSMDRTLKRPESNDLNENAVDWSYFEPGFYTPTTYLRTARSCSFGCAFCNYPAMAGPLTLSDLSTIENELRYLCEHGAQNLIVVDDTFNVPLPRFKQICRMMIENKFDLRWVSFFRCSNADDEAFDLMAEAGCMGVFLGIESGDQRILKNMTKFAKTDRYEYGIEQLTKRGLVTLASIVLGFPGENEESVQNTLDFVNRTQPTFYNVQLYYHDVLAPIEKQREKYGIEGSGYSWRHSSMSWQEAVEHKDDFVRGVTGSALMPLYGLSIWCIPYLLSKGLTMSQITEFTRAATQLVVKGLNADYLDPEEGIDSVVRALASA